ncbi:MAG TPA: ABC transporter ATP-binding protein [Solirubrobacteraceae bacterium]|nr:ABC transporter ATP-binding protein [Solirubrobacteraceae bacterium]
MLELREVVKRFAVGDAEPVRAVDGVSLSVADGELVALYGPSGSGKSTLLLLAAAVMRPDSGVVLLDQEHVSAFSPSEAAEYRMNTVGFVRQSLDLIPGASALDNAALKLLGKRAAVRDAQRQVAPLLDRLGLGDRLKHRAEDLSMGERQRVMIARALSTEPRLLLADEPTGSLDSERGQQVLSLLSELCRERGIAVLLVTHDPRAAAFADRVLTLRDGMLEDAVPATGEGC